MVASVSQRMWAALFDGLAIFAWLVFVILVQPWPEPLHGAAKIALTLLPAVLWEPVSVALTGRTLGQSLMGLSVVSVGDTPLGLRRALLRHFVKLGLLGASIFYAPFSSRGQAVHDHLFDTVVVHGGRPEALPPGEPFRWHELLLSIPIYSVAAGFATTFLAVLVLALLTVILPSALDSELVDRSLELVFTIVSAVFFFRLLYGRAARVRSQHTAGPIAAYPPTKAAAASLLPSGSRK